MKARHSRVAGGSMASNRRFDLRLVPLAIFVALLVLVPLGRTIWLGLRRSTGSSTEFVGVDNLVTVVTSTTWWTAVAVSVGVAVAVMLLQIVFALGFATSLLHVGRSWPWARIVVLAPAALAAVVTSSAALAAVDQGFVATWFDLDDAGPGTRLLAVALAEAWRTGGIVTVLVYVGLQRVTPAVLDLALADGASVVQRWRTIAWPAVAPAVVLVAGYRLLDMWRFLDGPVLADEGASGRATAPLLVWNSALADYETGVAAAAALVLLVVSIGLSVIAIVSARHGAGFVRRLVAPVVSRR